MWELGKLENKICMCGCQINWGREIFDSLGREQNVMIRMGWCVIGAPAGINIFENFNNV